MPIHLYVEHLINIRSLSIQASLSSHSNQETKAKLYSNGGVLTLTHEGESASITLPVNVGGGGDALLHLPAFPSKDISLRLQVDEKADGAAFLKGTVQSSETVIPWSATALSDQTEVYCKACDVCLVPHGQVQTWKDLPSEGWAEMMEFWHCHKPHEPDDQDHGSSKKGYAANNTLNAVSTVGLVSTTSFLLAADDCQNVKVENCAEEAATLINCGFCEARVGVLDTSTQGYKLAKRNLSISHNSYQPPERFDDELWMSCYLLDSMDNQGLRKFTVSPRGNDEQQLLLWIFTPDLNVSSSAAPSPEPLRCVKVLWKYQPVEEKSGMLDQRSLAEGELEMPATEAVALTACLEASAGLLTEGAKKFQDWKVALLQRFCERDVKPSLSHDFITLP